MLTDNHMYTIVYYRAVLLLYHQSNVRGFIFGTEGFYRTISLLNSVDPTDITTRDIERATWAVAQYSSGFGEKTQALLEVSFKWKYYDLWELICDGLHKKLGSYNALSSSITMLAVNYINGIKVFGLETVQPLYVLRAVCPPLSNHTRNPIAWIRES